MPNNRPLHLARGVLRVTLLVGLVSPLACAVATQADPEFDDSAGSSGSGGASPTQVKGGSAAGGSAGSSSSAGSKPTAGSGAFGGSAGAGSKAGSSSGGASAGSNAGGSSQSGGASGAGGGTTPMGCTGLKQWVGGDPTLTIAAGETIAWQGKRYTATTNVAYPNAECAPDAPAAWCADWFEPDGDC